ncbi:kelch-like protein diablo [Nematostella vectensis]|uniref:kelch-like protein diablo n=1 Tax=Nematostella vectensis TaxID=45351 RepID=UPI00138FE63F|nr:kelch-like protein diablo [Nematostella vectensis]
MEMPSIVQSQSRLTFSRENHEKRLLELLNEQRKATKFCDVLLEVGDSEIAAHRAILSASIPVLSERLSDRKEGLKIKLEGLQHNAVKAIVDYLYTSCLDVPADSVLNVYLAARSLGMNELVSDLEDFIRKEILPTEWLAIRVFAVRNDVQELLAMVEEFIANNIEEIFQKQAFLKLPRLQVELTARHSEDSPSMEPGSLCQLAVHWVYSQLKDDDEATTSALLEHTHIMYLTDEGKLKECTLEDLDTNTYKFIATDAQAKNIRHNSMEQLTKADVKENLHSDDEGVFIIESNNNKRRKATPRESMFRVIAAFQSSECDVFGFGIIDSRLAAISIHQQLQMSCHDSVSSESSGYDEWSLVASMSRGRCSVGAAEVNGKLYAVGGYDRGQCLETVAYYDIQTNEWMPVTSLRRRRGRLQVAILGGKMYAVGGSDGHSELNSCECYDEASDSWHIVAPMNYCRSNFGMATINNRIYVVGGYQGSHNLKTAEVYNPDSNKWVMVTPMSSGRDNLSAVALDGKMYVLGGYNGWAYFNTVECYTPETDSWSFVTPMKFARRGAGAAAVGGYLYVIGGYDGTSFLTSCERYDPSTNEWTTIAEMNTPRHNVGVAVVNGLIFAVGGFNGSAFLKTMEYYDPKTNKWSSFVSSFT